MKYIFSLFCLLLSGALCNAQRLTTLNLGGTANKNYVEKIPYEYINGGMFVTVEINGKPRKFFFDTGAPTQVSPELFKELRSPVVTRLKISDATGREDSVSVTTIPEIKWQGLLFSNIPALITDADVYQCWHIDGVIGSNLLRKSIVRIDPVEHMITISDDIDKLPVNKKLLATMLMDNWQSSPEVVLWVTPKKTQLVGFDTGDAGFLMATEDFLDRFKKNGAYTKTSTGFGIYNRSLFGLNVPDSIYRVKLPSITLAGCIFTNVTTETNKTKSTRMGTKVLDYGVVTLDYIHHLFYFEPNTTNTDLAEKKWPLQPIAQGNKLIIGVVWQSLKEQAKPGEQIIAINDKPYETISLCDWIEKSEMMPGQQTATLTIKDQNGTIKKITMVRE